MGRVGGMTRLDGPTRVHGGPGPAGPVRWDFSSNAHGAGPCPTALQAVQRADPGRYPDATYHTLRRRLAEWHGVAPQRIVLAASASEFIQRITAVSGRLRPGAVAVPAHAYGDYVAAAGAWGRALVSGDDDRGAPGPITLRWCADPGSPLGKSVAPPSDPAALPTVVDRVYAPLRLHGTDPWAPAILDQVFQLHSPNKALGLTGVRGAYAVAPAGGGAHARALREALRAAEPSWPLGAHGVAMLMAWTEPATQRWLHDSLPLLRRWTQDLRDGLHALRLEPMESDTPFFCARRPHRAGASWLHARGLAVRDTKSFGLPGWMRVSAQPPEATQALLHAMRDALDEPPHSSPPDIHLHSKATS
jgi:histidinol-phosphate aminotransferase